MEVWNVGEMIVMLVGAGGGGVFAVWRIVRNESETRRREFETLREESREAHEKIGGQITDVRKELRGEISEVRKEITEVRKELGGEITEVREGIAGLQGEMKGMRDSLLTLREDFRAHVLAET